MLPPEYSCYKVRSGQIIEDTEQVVEVVLHLQKNSRYRFLAITAVALKV